MKVTITWNSLLPGVVGGDRLTNQEEVLKHLRIAKQQLEDEWKFYREHEHRLPQDQREFEIDGDRGLLLNDSPQSGGNIVWERERIMEMIHSTEQILAAEAAEKPKRRGPKLDEESNKILEILTASPAIKATEIAGTLYPKLSGDPLNQAIDRIQRKLTYLKKRL
jgi:hypothetical protein